MSIVERVIEFITNDLNIKISKKNKDLINDKFYPDMTNKIYWFYDGAYELYEGIISKNEYEKIKTIPPDTEIDFPEIAKYVNDECYFKDISFSDDLDKIKNMYDKKNIGCLFNILLMDFLYENEIISE